MHPVYHSGSGFLKIKIQANYHICEKIIEKITLKAKKGDIKLENNVYVYEYQKILVMQKKNIKNKNRNLIYNRKQGTFKYSQNYI